MRKTSRVYKRLTEAERKIRFFTFVRKDESCWLWTGSKSKAKNVYYGNFFDGIGKVLAHRYSYLIHKGQIGKGLTVDHLCQVRLCVNPDHLRAVTMRENIQAAQGANSRAVLQFDKNGKLIKKWFRMASVKEQLGFDIANISSAASGRSKTAYGFIWKYDKSHHLDKNDPHKKRHHIIKHSEEQRLKWRKTTKEFRIRQHKDLLK